MNVINVEELTHRHLGYEVSFFHNGETVTGRLDSFCHHLKNYTVTVNSRRLYDVPFMTTLMLLPAIVQDDTTESVAS